MVEPLRVQKIERINNPGYPFHYMNPRFFKLGCDHGETNGNFSVVFKGSLTDYLNLATIGYWVSPDETGYWWGVGAELSSAEPLKAEVLSENGTYGFPCNIHVRKGEFVEIVYDGGKVKRLYFPEIVGEIKTLYFAEDGSSYYDSGLTQLAQAKPKFPYWAIPAAVGVVLLGYGLVKLGRTR